MLLLRSLLIITLATFPAILTAQGLKVAFGEMEQDSNVPVEVTADSLSVNQNDGSAVFNGNVHIAQGEMRMSADKVNVHYREDAQGIARLVANGDVLLVQGEDVAEADKADYSIETGTVVMTGNVTVVQGANTVTADEMTINLQDNTAEMHGRVKTVLRTE
ncbi:lipopolysaccharide transport periplasmic protein LptA [Shimia sp.]|uniref:lipopolysaccharide transport periplasmic protein LptA n=1 Tax=Shimia sp. TaxID=1954381 RepID=UPI00329766A0